MKKLFFYLFLVFMASACSKNESMGIDPNGRPKSAASPQAKPTEEIATGDGGAFIDPFGRTKAANTQQQANNSN